MKKIVKKPAAKKAKAKNDLDLPANVMLDDDDELEAHEIVDDTIDAEVLKVLKPAKPKPQQHKASVPDKHDYIAELEREDTDIDE